MAHLLKKIFSIYVLTQFTVDKSDRKVTKLMIWLLDYVTENHLSFSIT